ncbi:MAG: division/cell wall cluster transcriptional repressor MraZ [Thermoguttaceae bacterium]
MLLTGEFLRSIDDKRRVAIPKRLRDALASDRQAVYLTPGTDQSLALYAEDAFARLADRLAQASPTRQDVRTFNRLFYARAQRVELDSQGRVRVPPELAELAGLSKDVMLLGVQDHVEIWAADRWRSYLAERRGHYDEIAEAAFR